MSGQIMCDCLTMLPLSIDRIQQELTPAFQRLGQLGNASGVGLLVAGRHYSLSVSPGRSRVAVLVSSDVRFRRIPVIVLELYSGSGDGPRGPYPADIERALAWADSREALEHLYDHREGVVRGLETVAERLAVEKAAPDQEPEAGARSILAG